MGDETEIYGAVGGDQPFFQLVDEFYKRVEVNQPLRAMYPPDLTTGKDHLAWFLIQRFGGPSYFNQQRGAPMLRMRHNQFRVTPGMRDAWLADMVAALDRVPVFEPFKRVMTEYFESTSTFLINHDEAVAGRTPLTTV